LRSMIAVGLSCVDCVRSPDRVENGSSRTVFAKADATAEVP
jgi:hypothetical protein